MRGLTRLCLVGFILTVALYQGGTAPTPTPKTKSTHFHGVWHPLEDNSTRRPAGKTNATSIPGIWHPLELELTHPTADSVTEVKHHQHSIHNVSQPQAVHHNNSKEAAVKDDAVERP